MLRYLTVITFKTNVKVTPFMMATSEFCCKDRRGVTPQHVFYMAVQILQLRVSERLMTLSDV
jgi:hypothetical protein